MRRWFDEARRAAGLTALVAGAIAAFPIVLVPAFGWFLALRDTHVATYVLLMENGVVELLTFAAFLAAAVVAALFAARLARAGAPGPAARFYGLFGLASFVAAMEEIAWGQSFLDFATPAGLRRINDQGETTIHNLRGLQDLNAFLLLAFGVAACAAVWLGRHDRWRTLAAPSLLLPYAATIAATGAACFAVDVFYFGKTFDLLIGMLSEVVELLMGVFLLLYVTLNARASGASTLSLTASDTTPSSR